MVWERIIALKSKSSKYVSEIVSNLGVKLWDILWENIKKDESRQDFKKIKNKK